jgi:fructose-1,6-bisphosphatase II
MLYIGERVGQRTEDSPKIDIALDPLEGTTICANGGVGSISVIAVAEKGNFLHAPDTYMAKIACGPEAKGKIDIDASPTENIRQVALALGKEIEDVTVVILDRPRHEGLIAEVRKAGARIHLIGDGDVSAAIACAWPGSGIDLLIGTGGAPEGVISAAALQCLGGDFQGRLQFRNDEEKARATKMGIKNLEKKYSLEELACGSVMFCATGVTDGPLLKGVKTLPGRQATTHSIVMRSQSGTIRTIEAHHQLSKKPGHH